MGELQLLHWCQLYKAVYPSVFPFSHYLPVTAPHAKDQTVVLASMLLCSPLRDKDQFVNHQEGSRCGVLITNEDG